MKHINKLMVFFVFMLFGYGVDALAYTYKITNQTGRDVKIRLYWLVGELTNDAVFIRSRGTHKFVVRGWSSGLCLTKIMVWTRDSSGKWWGPAKAKIKARTKITNWDSLGDLSPPGGVGSSPGWTPKGCKDQKFILRMDSKTWKISATS